MASSTSRLREKIVELPEVAAEAGQLGTPQYETLNKYRPRTGAREDLLTASNRLIELQARTDALKARFHLQANRFSPWQLLGDRVQEVWQYPASPLSPHAAIVPPPYAELVAIENQLANLFRDPERFSAQSSHTQRALDELETKFQNYQTDSKHGRQLVKTAVKVGAILPAAPFIVGGGPLLGAGAAAIATAAAHTAVENEEAALEGTKLSWSHLMAEAAKSGGSAFLEAFVLTKFSPFLVARLPGDIGARISDGQLAWLGTQLGRVLTRTKLIKALSHLTAELWATLLASSAATCFELTFDVFRSKGEMTLGEFASSLVTNIVAAGGLHILVGALTHHTAQHLIPIRITARSQLLRHDSHESEPTHVAPHLHPPRDHHADAGEPVPSEHHTKSPGASSIEELAETLRSECGSVPSTAAGPSPARGAASSLARSRTAGSLSEQSSTACER